MSSERRKRSGRTSSQARARRRKRARRKRFVYGFVAALAAIVIIGVIVMVIDHGNDTGSEVPVKVETETVKADAAETAAAGIQFPYEIDGGKLTVNSLFQSSIANPDCGDQMGEEIASLEVENTSEEYIRSAVFTVTTTDGAEYHFTVDGLPQGKKATVFSKDNEKLVTESCESIECNAEYESDSEVIPEQIDVSVDEVTVTLTNHTEEDLSNMTAVLHFVLGDTYYGGTAYRYPVESIPAGQSISFEASECYVDTVEVVALEDN